MKIKSVTAAFALAGIFAAAYSLPAHAQAGSATAPAATAAAAIAPVVIQVEPGDTLSAIAKVHQTTYVRLYNANEHIQHPDIIRPGDKLRVPAADEQLPQRPWPGIQSGNAQPAAQAVAARTQASSSARAYARVAADGVVWDRLAQCEASGNWAINTGNGYYGGLQFTAHTWNRHGGGQFAASANQASREQQIIVGERVLASQGWGAWPACSAKLGLR